MHTEKVIIYSPQNSIAELVEAMITECKIGIEIVHTASTNELIEKTNALHPKLIIILDISPLINGDDIVTKIREKLTLNNFRQRKHNTAIYVITWLQSEESILSLLEAGIDQYLTFPICIERLRCKVREQFERVVRHR